jgi:hypothetical protein
MQNGNMFWELSAVYPRCVAWKGWVVMNKERYEGEDVIVQSGRMDLG